MDITREHDITIGEVKSYAMFAHFTDEQAREVIDTLKQLSVIIFKYHQNKKKRALNPQE
ncbi:MAG TPA: hypothetical protein VIM89_15325 [Mucilaginibacter sp.]